MLHYNELEHKFIREKDGIQEELLFLYNDKSSEGELFDISCFNDYIFLELYNTAIKDDSIYELIIKERIGMLLPFVSVTNLVVSLSGSILNEWYLFLATAYYLLNKDRIDNDSDAHNKCFAILEKKKLKVEYGVDGEYIRWALISENYYSEVGRENSLSAADMCQKKKMHLKVCSPYLYDNSYIKSFYRKYIYERDLIKRFLYCYQIIELLLDDILIETLHSHIIKCQNGNLSLRGNLDNMTESSRFNMILEKAGLHNNLYFDAVCKDFLKKIGKDISQVKFPDSLYQVRNSVVHRLRFIVNTPLEQELSIINDYFELFINRLVANYNKSYKLTIDDHLWFYKNISDCK